MTEPVHVSDDSKLAIPLRNLISILGVVSISTWAYSGIMQRLNKIETKQALDESHIKDNTNFRIGWPRGEFGALPADAKQDMNIETLARQLQDLKEDVEKNEEWINDFEPPSEVRDTVRRVRELEIQLSRMQAQLNNK